MCRRFFVGKDLINCLTFNSIINCLGFFGFSTKLAITLEIFLVAISLFNGISSVPKFIRVLLLMHLLNSFLLPKIEAIRLPLSHCFSHFSS